MQNITYCTLILALEKLPHVCKIELDYLDMKINFSLKADDFSAKMHTLKHILLSKLNKIVIIIVIVIIIIIIIHFYSAIGP